MKQEIKKKWIEALRSGEYKQTQGSFRQDRRIVDGVWKLEDCFCVLGVLCDLAVKDGVTEWELTFWGHDDHTSIYLIDGHRGTLGRRVSKWAGLNQYEAYRLWVMNDKGNASFDELAKFIEDTL